MKSLAIALTISASLAATAPAFAAVKTVVLVHGAFADGSGWQAVMGILQKDGYTVRVVQPPETALADDVAATRRILDQAGPCVLVGHSYGGTIITEAGTHPNVRSLVYVAAFEPDVGESTGALNAKMPAAAASIGPAGGNFLQVDPAKFAVDFAADLPSATAAFMASSQVPISADALGSPVTAAAWKNKPSFAIVAKDDRMINPDLERFMTARAKSQTIELPGSHAVYISHAPEVAALIEKAAQAAE